jgi:hypothetical protein
MRRSFLYGALACLVFLTAGCPGRNQLEGMSDSTFVDVMARLHRVEMDQRLVREQRDSVRAIILEERGITPEQLESAAQSLAAQPDRAIALWQAIEQRSQYPDAPPPDPMIPAIPGPY